MAFIYTDNRDHREMKIANAAIKNDWVVSDIFMNDRDFCSSYLSEKTRLNWAPILVALAFGENTAFSGFGSRIATANDISTRNWLCIHLLDEAKHTDGFSSLLNYLYPSYKGKQDALFSARDVVKFYGHTHKTKNLVEWLICTQIAEVYGRQCYKSLHLSLNDEPIASKFLGYIIKDEARHIAYISSLIHKIRVEMQPKAWDELKPFIHNMIKLGRNMFEARKKGKNYFALKSLDIDVSSFCDLAEQDLKSSYL